MRIACMATCRASCGWGEYLIWHTAPEDKVFIDGRYDTVYPFKVIGDYLEFYFDQPGASAVLESFRTISC